MCKTNYELDGIPSGDCYCTINVVVLYLHIRHGEGLKTFRKAIDCGKVKTPTWYRVDLVELILILMNNYLEFNGIIYRQSLAAVIGTKFTSAQLLLIL